MASPAASRQSEVRNALSPKYEAILGEKYSRYYKENVEGKLLVQDVPIEQSRREPILLDLGIAPGPEVGVVKDMQVQVRDGAKIPIRIWYPQRAKEDLHAPDASTYTLLPCYINYHGGGWVVGDLNEEEAFIRILVKEAHTIVIDVGYRLAPEHKFPTPIYDCWDAYDWIVENSQLLGIEARMLAVGGFSAGGHIAATVCQMARDRELRVRPCFQLLVIPVTDASGLDSEFQLVEGMNDAMRQFRGHHTDSKLAPRLSTCVLERALRCAITILRSHHTTALLSDPLLSPLKAKSLAGLPPALVVAAEVDVLRDEGIAYAKRLAEESGSWTEIWLARGVPHPFPYQTLVTDRAIEFQQLAIQRLKQAFSGKLGEKQFLSNI